MIHTHWGWLALVGGGVLVPAARGRRLAAGGLGALALALGGLRVSGDPGRMPGDIAAVEQALMVVGTAVLAGAVLPSVHASRPGAAAAVLAAVGLILLQADLQTVVRAAPPAGAAAAVGVVAGTALLAWVAGGRLLRRSRAGAALEGRSSGRWIGGAAAGVLLAAIGPHILLIFAGVALAAGAIGAEGFSRQRFSAAWTIAITVATLGPAGWLLAAIAAGQGLAIVALPDIPLSPAAEASLAPLLLLAAWSLAGLWPLPRSPLAGLAGLAGVFLVGRVAVPALLDGLDHWRPLAYPLLAVGLWQAVASRRWASALVGGALFALIAGSRDGVVATWWLGTGALIAWVAASLARREAAWPWCLSALAAGLGALPATTAGLEGEVVYTTLTVAGLAVLLAAGD